MHSPTPIQIHLHLHQLCELCIICLIMLYKRSSTLWKKTKISHTFLTLSFEFYDMQLVNCWKQRNKQTIDSNAISKVFIRKGKFFTYMSCFRPVTFFFSVMCGWVWPFPAWVWVGMGVWDLYLPWYGWVWPLFWLGVGEFGWVWPFFGWVWVGAGRCLWVSDI